MKKLFYIFAASFLTFACSQIQKNEKPSITVSILPQKYFVERIVGDKFNIHVITPPGASPETYEPIPRQMKTLTESKLYFANGYLMFEDHLAEKLGRELMTKMVDLSQGIDLIAGDIVEHGDHVHLHGVDPHYWLSPREVKIQAENILLAILDLDPDNATFYKDNYYAFISDIEKLEEHITISLADANLRTFLIYHPAFAYFAREFDLEQVALEMDGKEPTATHIRKISDMAKEKGISTVLIQSQFNMAAAEVVAREIGGKVEILDPLPEDWLENMYAITLTIRNALNP